MDNQTNDFKNDSQIVMEKTSKLQITAFVLSIINLIFCVSSIVIVFFTLLNDTLSSQSESEAEAAGFFIILIPVFVIIYAFRYLPDTVHFFVSYLYRREYKKRYLIIGIMCCLLGCFMINLNFDFATSFGTSKTYIFAYIALKVLIIINSIVLLIKEKNNKM